MNLLRKRPARIEVEGGFIYNSFPKISLGNGFGVVVNTLVLGTEDARGSKTDRFAYSTERQIETAKSIRIVATCIAPVCGSQQFHLRDSKNGQATEYFVPEEGLDLKEGRYLPPVLVHEFGILGLGFIDNDFYQEMSHNKEVGIVFTVPK